MFFKQIIKPLLITAVLGISNATYGAISSSTTAKWPQVNYDNSVPSIYSELGYKIGQRISSHADMIRYFEALQEAQPKRIKLFEYGRSWEGRKLIYAVIGNEQNIANLTQFTTDMQALSDPRRIKKSQANKLIDSLPGSVWLQYGVHGNEISSTDAAMMTAYHLLAGAGETIVDKIMDNNLVFIDPLQNPDGRSRFIAHYYSTVGLKHSDDRLSAEHNEPWPNGRTNHYLFDLNRDWLPITQPETKGRIASINKYHPIVVVDLHEMQGDQSYYFAPSAQPVTPNLSKAQSDNIDAIGRNNGKHFDKNGIDYFTREIFDSFYPGYGVSWPTFTGAATSTYEVASARGEKFKRLNGTTFTYEDTVFKHFIASISTAESVADNRKKYLQDYYQYQIDAIQAGKSDKKERVYILPNERDRAGNFKLAKLMTEHGVEVFQTTSNIKLCGNTYQSGSYYIDSAQPRGKLVKTTFTQQVNMSKAFLSEQERRRERKLKDQIYDVTGWSLPLMYNLDIETCGKPVSGDHRLVKLSDTLKGNVSNINASVAYIVPWGDMAAGRFLTAALQAGLHLKTIDRAFVLDNNTRYPAGSLVIEVAANTDHKTDLANIIQSIAEETGALVEGVNTSWVTDGPNFGSGQAFSLKAPNVAMAWNIPTSALSAGNTRFVIEQEFGYPVTAIPTQHLINADLSHYQVLILPAGNYKKVLGKDGGQNLHKWVNAGGVLITLGSATQFAASPDINLLAVKRELAIKKQSTKKETDDEQSPLVAGKAYTSFKEMVQDSENLKESPDDVAGILANVSVDQEHWLTAGVPPNIVGLVRGKDIYTPIRLASGKNLAWFKGKDEVLASGYMWQENKEQLAYKPFIIHQPMGKGMVIAFPYEQTTRAYVDGVNLMLFNSIFSASAHTTDAK